MNSICLRHSKKNDTSFAPLGHMGWTGQASRGYDKCVWIFTHGRLEIQSHLQTTYFPDCPSEQLPDLWANTSAELSQQTSNRLPIHEGSIPSQSKQNPKHQTTEQPLHSRATKHVSQQLAPTTPAAMNVKNRARIDDTGMFFDQSLQPCLLQPRLWAPEDCFLDFEDQYYAVGLLLMDLEVQ